MANEYLAILLVDELNTFLLIEYLSDISVPGLGILPDPINSIFLAHFTLLLRGLGDLELLESKSNGLAGHFGHHVDPITFDGDSQLLTFFQLLLGGKNQFHGLLLRGVLWHLILNDFVR